MASTSGTLDRNFIVICLLAWTNGCDDLEACLNTEDVLRLTGVAQVVKTRFEGIATASEFRVVANVFRPGDRVVHR